MKYRCVLETMYEISESLHRLVNSIGNTLDGRFLFHGKLYESEDACKKEVGTEVIDCWTGGFRFHKENFLKKPFDEHTIDFRHVHVDDAIADEGKRSLIYHVMKFCSNNKDGDWQTLLIGCALNIYYTSGLFDRCGILPVSLFYGELFDEDTKRYAALIEQWFSSQVAHFYYSLGKSGLFSNKSALDYLKKYEKCIGDERQNTSDKILKEMREINDTYTFANRLSGIDATRAFFDTGGINQTFLEYNVVENLEKLKEQSSLRFKLIGETLKMEHPGCYTEFGLGMPYIEYTTEDIHGQHIDKLIRPRPRNNDDIKKELGHLLRTPCIIQITGTNMDTSLILTHKLYKSEQAKQKALDDKKLIINRFSHTYMNMRATSLHTIATELIKQDEKTFRDFGRKLLYEYSIKKNLSRDVEMLKLRFEDRMEELNERIRGSILQPGCGDGVGIRKLASDALTRCMVTLVHDGTAKGKRVREGFRGSFDLIEIRNSFEENVLLSETPDVIGWFGQNVFDLRFNFSDCWNEICFEDDSYAALLLVDIIAELITNIFKYADMSEPAMIELADDGECLVIKSQNTIRTDVRAALDGGYGLASEGDAIEVLNKANGYDAKHAIEHETENNLFNVKVSIVRDVFNA